MIEIKFLKAGNGDCFIISFLDNEGIPRNILIDSGRAETYFDSVRNKSGNLKEEIELIKSKQQNIDLAILSHIDNDHICGFLEWFKQDNNAHSLIKNIWFNSGKLIAEYLKEPENPELIIGLKIFTSPNTGVNEAVDFEEYLLKHGIWERKIVNQGIELNDFGVSMKVLSPSDLQLRRLLKEYTTKLGSAAFTAGKEMDWGKSLREFIQEEKEGYQFVQDNSPKNGSSISFILSIKGKSFLFLADSPPSVIVESLKSMGYSNENQLEVDLLKVSHHGSKGNTSKELLELIKTNNYLISTDSTGHNHPNKRVLARIVDQNPNAVFHFNYLYVKENIMLPQDFDGFKSMKIDLTPKLIF